jgi:apolipoprotein N-acyltransferase
LRDETTLATTVGEVPEWIAAGALLLLLVDAVRRRRRTAPVDPRMGAADSEPHDEGRG